MPSFTAAAALACLMGAGTWNARTAQDLPGFQEVYDLIRTNLPDINETELNRAAVEGMISELRPRVRLITSDSESNPAPVLGRTEMFDGNYAYLRIERVDKGLADAVRKAMESLLVSNTVSGVALDLRFTGGEDYSEAADTANLFVRREHDLLDWGEGMLKSSKKWDAVTVPVTVLMNTETISAAEAMAAVLRETGAALLIGSRTAGQTTVSRDVNLGGGYRLLLAGRPVEIGGLGKIPPDGLEPDVEVKVKPEREKVYLKDPYKVFGDKSGATIAGAEDLTFRNRISEADLVRERRMLLNPDGPVEQPSAADDGDDRSIIRDPVLARAVDLLKGLAILKQNRSR